MWVVGFKTKISTLWISQIHSSLIIKTNHKHLSTEYLQLVTNFLKALMLLIWFSIRCMRAIWTLIWTRIWSSQMRNNHLATYKISLNLAQILSNKLHQPPQVHKVKTVILNNKNFKCNNSNSNNLHSSNNKIIAIIAMSKDQLQIFCLLMTSLSLVKLTIIVQMFNPRTIIESNLMPILGTCYA